MTGYRRRVPDDTYPPAGAAASGDAGTDLLVSLDRGVLTLTINRPERRNAVDGPTEWWIDLDHDAKAIPEHAKADTAIRGTRSDLLLWLNNRGPLESLEVFGDQKILDRWGQLTF